MSLENKLTYLNGTKDAIKQAIIDKGVSVTEADTFRSYATKIGEIQGGSGGDCPKGVLDLSDGVKNSFRVTSEIKEIILPSNMDNVRNMSSCFSGLSSLTSITLPTSLPNVTNISYCFYSCQSLTNLTLPSSLSKVTNIAYCFGFCIRLTSLTLPDLSLVTNMNSCFAYCSSLTSITLPDLPLVRNMIYCFDSCKSLQNLVIGNINPNITTLTNWYISDCTALTVESLVNIMNALPTITNTRTCTIGTTNLSKLSPEQLAIGVDKGWSIN